jgi:hypothetical protein
MPLLTELYLFTFGFYKDVAPTALLRALDALPKCPVEIVQRYLEGGDSN